MPPTPALAIIRIGIDPVVRLGGLSLHWYGVMYALAFATAYWYGVRPYLERHGIGRETSESMLLWVIVAGLLGARLYYDVQTDFASRLHDPVQLIAVWNGGMAFFGAILGGGLAIAVLARLRGYSFWLLWDAGVIFAVIGQPIGRIGNIINGDILGDPSTLPWAMAYTNTNAVLQQPGHALCDALSCTAYVPAALYEALGTVLIGLVLYALLRRGVRVGVIGVVYVALYALSQLVVFQFRTEPVYAGLKQAQWTALGVLCLAFPLLVLLYRRSHDPIKQRVALGDGSRADEDSAAREHGMAAAGEHGADTATAPEHGAGMATAGEHGADAATAPEHGTGMAAAGGHEAADEDPHRSTTPQPDSPGAVAAESASANRDEVV